MKKERGDTRREKPASIFHHCRDFHEVHQMHGDRPKGFRRPPPEDEEQTRRMNTKFVATKVEFPSVLEAALSSKMTDNCPWCSERRHNLKKYVAQKHSHESQYIEFHLAHHLSAVGSPARASTVCPRFHLMFALTHFPIRANVCSLQYIEYYLHSQYYSRSTSYSHITQLLPWLTGYVPLCFRELQLKSSLSVALNRHSSKPSVSSRTRC
jgi:hypothetical protein